MVGTAYCDDEGLAEADEDEEPGLDGLLIEGGEGWWRLEDRLGVDRRVSS